MTASPGQISQTACVVRTDGDRAWVTCRPRAGCQRCAEGRGCGGGVLQAWLTRRGEEVEVINRVGAAVGQRVEISVPTRAAVSAALRLYGVPLAVLLLGALVGATVWPHIRDIAALIGAALGLILGIFAVRVLHGRTSPLVPRISHLYRGDERNKGRGLVDQA